MAVVQLPAAAWEILLENEALLDVRGLEQSPPRGVMGLRVHRVAQLEHQHPLDAFVDTEIMRLGDPHAAVVTDFDQVLVLDGISQAVIERACSASHIQRRRVESLHLRAARPEMASAIPGGTAQRQKTFTDDNPRLLLRF